MSNPLAYFITWTTYGTHLHGHKTGSVDRAHNAFGTPFVYPDSERELGARDRMMEDSYRMDSPRRAAVMGAIREVCEHRGWSLFAAHVRTTHVHIIVRSDGPPERVCIDFKAYASRRLNRDGFDTTRTVRWTRHGSTRYLWGLADVEGAVHYVLNEQGIPMERYIAENSEYLRLI